METDEGHLKPGDLRCEHKINPLGIDVPDPAFSWITISDRKNSYQTAYRIIVSSESGDIWDSGKVVSDISHSIIYIGNQLTSDLFCRWKVMIWDENDVPSEWSEPAYFSTGIFKKEEWKAKWISHVYKEKKTDAISFTEKIDKWIWATIKTPGERFNKVQLSRSFNIEDAAHIRSAVILVTADEKFILHLNDKLIAESDDKIFSWTRPFTADIKKFLKEGKNTLLAAGTNSYVDKPGFILKLQVRYKTGEIIEIRTDENWEAVSASGDKQKAFVTALAGEKPWRVPEAGLKFNPAAFFRKTFPVKKNAVRAFVHSSAMGLYNLRMNGREVSSSKFSPLWSDYNNRIYYNTYDVTHLLNSDKLNVVNVILADGYYSGYCGWEKGRGYYGKYPAVKLQLNIVYEDGSTEVIGTDETWLSSEGPIREADILMGEYYDSSLETLIENWELPEAENPDFRKVIIRNDADPELTAYPAEAVKIRFEIKPADIRKTAERKFIIDFGQNFAGYVRLTLPDAGRRKIILKYAEVLNPDGSLYRDNIRMARAEDTYISKGDTAETWEPLFTYHGFRYAEITGPENITNDMITGVSINSLEEQTGFTDSSDDKLNKLKECILWNQRSNYADIPTDCPQRDERFGWSGDAVSFFKTAACNYDVSAFYYKWMTDFFDEQKENGELPPFAPLPDMGVGPVYFDSAGWADAGIITPYLFYQHYGDQRLVKKYYPKMKKFMLNLADKNKNLIMPEYGYGDWLFSGEETSRSLIGTAYFAYDAYLMSRIAILTGNEKDSEYFNELFENIRDAFRKEFTGAGGVIKNATQTAAVLALCFNLLEPEGKENTAAYLIKDIEERDYHITAGFLGLSFLFRVLSEMGRNDLAWKILTNSGFPSWYFMIDHGATTLWERWDSFHPGKGFYDPTMNSFNHCSLGCIGEWIYSDLAGIKLSEPGYKKFVIDPFIPEDLDYFKTSLKTVYGEIKSEWKKIKDEVTLKFKIPFNTKAVIKIPSTDYIANFEYNILKQEKNKSELEVGSGEYEVVFRV